MDLEKKKPLVLLLVFVLLFSGVSILGFALNDLSPDNLRVACVGDSITERSGYTTKLQTLLGKDYLVGNFGVSGSAICGCSRLPYINQFQFSRAVAFNPDIVLIMLGTNDANRELTGSDQSLEEDYTRLIQSFQSLPSSPKVIIVKSPPIFTSEGDAYNNTNLVTNVNPRVSVLAAQMNLPTVDMYEAFGNHSEFFADGVHPNDDGAALIASTICDAITDYPY
ncbi:MAG: GDSL-type esterase/lipase family protein [Candidatus Bathyarchaeota archaeon]|nr:GDSL-type esterase/lipase family protein [Candidatus Bathyarchaeota archaeon]